jgi:hypothetical protein
VERAAVSRRERQIVAGLSIVIAATRLLALARSMWDWDEFLFAFALHDYNVAVHHPHPPGFPLFIAVARLVRVVIHDDFHALRTVSLIASMFLFPAIVALARAMKFPFGIAVSAGVLFAFLPNVWFYGGTAFSDIFNMALLLAALALLVRPQNVLCAYPWFAAAWRIRRWRVIAASAAMSIVIVAGGYGIAAKVTGWDGYLAGLRNHQHYIATTDGYLNPRRPPSLTLFPLFAIDPFEGGKASRFLFGFACLALIIPKKRDAEAVATFFPFLVFALFLSNITGASRLSIGYMPLHALLAADGIARVANGAAMLLRRPRAALIVQTLVVAAIAGRFALWSGPALREVKSHDSPPVLAVKWVRDHVPIGSTLFIDGGLEPHATYYLGSYDVHYVDSEEDLARMPLLRNAWYIHDGPDSRASLASFRRPRKKLWALFTRRYFEASVRRVTGAVHYLDGWYGEESTGEETWRWMGRRARIVLQPIAGGGELRLSATVPIDKEPPPQVTISIDGQPADRFMATARDFSRRYVVAPSPNAHEVLIELSGALNPARQHLSDDARDLGLQLRTVSWQP